FALDVNQITPDLRTSIGGPLAAGENNPLLLNETVKRALAMCINRTGMVEGPFDGFTVEADSLFPEASRWHADDMSLPEFDPQAARSLLVANGWAYDSEGDPAGPTTVPLCKVGGAAPLNFRFSSPEGTTWESACILIRDWMEQAGIYLDYTPRTINEMNTIYYSAHYDLALGHYDSDLTDDPSLGTLRRFTTMAMGVGGDNRIFYTNSTYDSNYNSTLEEMVHSERSDTMDDMQKLLEENKSCLPIVHTKALYAANNRTWTDYGNWTDQPLLAPDSALPWLYMNIELRGDSPHDLAISHEPSDAGPGETIWFNGSAVDDTGDELTYSWDFGDSEGATGQNVTHAYDDAMAYTVTLTVTDPYGYEASYQVEIGVGVEIPEFGGMVVPVLILTAVVFAIRRCKRGERK
ncbi:MAG: PKD domain-containing protein, partial [Thermoplasmata archaeon]|nr:PKD domain-containing protein [Thermoplasmata archaeon]